MRNNKGFMLIISYLVVAVLLILVTAYVARSVSEMRTAQREKDSLSAFYAAESGIDYGLDWLRSHGLPGSTTNITAGPALTTGTYTVTLKPITSLRCQIIAVGRCGDATRTVNFEVRPDTFARQLWFTDSETFSGSSVWFITNDSLNGPVHTNGSFNIAGDPFFGDTAEESGSAINYMHGGPPNDNPTFVKGIDFCVEPTTMPTRATNLRNAAAAGGLVFTGNTTIVLNSNGTMNVTNATAGYSNTNLSLPSNGAIFVQNKISGRRLTEYGNLTLSGTLNGQLTVGANNNIIIADDIKYNDDPQVPGSTSTDTLGIIAERDVVISQSSCPTYGDLTIQASIMAMSDSFYLSNYTSTMKGDLNVFGGIIQKERGPVGTFSISNNQKVSGFTKNYIYDARLGTAPPPFFPTTGDYIGLSWREQ